MAVTTPIWGLTHSHNDEISPFPYVPISAMNTSVPGASCSVIARESPAALLKLAGVATTRRLPLMR